jgi:hypothetical protein
MDILSIQRGRNHSGAGQGCKLDVIYSWRDELFAVKRSVGFEFKGQY